MRSPIRVAILADFPLSALEKGAMGRGGGQGCTWLPQLALSYANMDDLEVHWLIINRNARCCSQTTAYGQVFHSLPGAKFSIDLAFNYLPARRTLRKALSQLAPDIIHAWGTERIYPAALADFPGPGLLSMQGVLTEYARIGGLPDDWRWRKMIRSEPEFMRSATIITAESRWGMERVREIVPDADLRMVEYGVHPGFYDVDWAPDPKQPYVLYVGGADFRKGADILLDAVGRITNRNWELRVAGDERLESMVIESGVKGVRCLGLLPWDDMKQQLTGAWCSVLPTRGDTSANSVKEARVVGVPVVSSAHGGHTGYINDGENGRIIDPLTAEELAGALSDVMSSHERVVELGRARHDQDREYLLPAKTAEAFADIYRELAAASKC